LEKIVALGFVETQVNEGTVTEAILALYDANGIDETNHISTTIEGNSGQPRVYVVFVVQSE